MGAFSIWHWLIVLVVVLVLFGGKGKISGLMGDFGKGLNAFKKGVRAPPMTTARRPPFFDALLVFVLVLIAPEGDVDQVLDHDGLGEDRPLVPVGHDLLDGLVLGRHI